MKEITNLVLSGGAANGYYMLGALDSMYRNSKPIIKASAGVSAGACIVVMLALGLEPKQIADEVSVLAAKGPEWNYTRMFTKGFVLNIQPYKDQLETMLAKHDVVTMNDLFVKTGVFVTIVTTNIDDCQAEYVDHVTHPDLSICEALLMSICIPLCFEPRVVNGVNYCDGALSDAFPLHLYSSEGTVGIYLKDHTSTSTVRKIINTILRRDYNMSKTRYPDHFVITLVKQNADVFMKASVQEQLGMYLSGKKQASEQMVDVVGENET